MNDKNTRTVKTFQRNVHWMASFCIAVIAISTTATLVPAALVSQYTFEADTLNTTLTTVNDDAGSNNGSLVADAVVIDSGNSARGQVLSVDGTGDYASIPDHASLDFTSGLALTGWFNQATGSSTDGFIAKEVASGKGWAIEIDPYRFYVWGPKSDQKGLAQPSENQWHHLAATYDGANATTYFNGMQVLTQAATGAITTNNDPVTIGRTRMSGNAVRHLEGTMDDVGIYNASIAGQEIALIHGLGRFSGIDQADPGIAAVLAAFSAGAGNSAVAGGDTWRYATAAELGNPSTFVGYTGGTPGIDTFVILDSSGNGVQLASSVTPPPPPPPPILSVDFSQTTDTPLQPGFEGFSFDDAQPHTLAYTSSAASDGDIDVTISGQTHFRDYATITGGPFLDQSDLLSDSVLRNANGPMTLTLGDLNPGTYEITTYHQSTATDGGVFDLYLTDSVVTDSLLFSDVTILDDSRTPFEITTLTFNFISDGSDVLIGMNMTGGRQLKFNGFELSESVTSAVVPEPSALSIWALGLLGLIGWRWRRTE